MALKRLDKFFDAMLPERFSPGEFPGESSMTEAIRRGAWKVLPETWLKFGWERLLLGGEGEWCFILGVNNSGTTLLHELLGRHPEVRTLPAEGQHLSRALTRPVDAGVRRLWSTRLDVFRWTEEHGATPATRALHDWGFHYRRQTGRVLLEKSPPNTIRSRWLQANFKNARFVAMTRHPCAVAEGIRRREGYELADAARHWSTANALLLEDLPHLEHSVMVRYEELCEDPRGTLQRITDFLDLLPVFAHDDFAGLDVHSMDQSVDTIENFNPRSFARLSEEEFRVIASETNDVADQLGYETLVKSDNGAFER